MSDYPVPFLAEPPKQQAPVRQSPPPNVLYQDNFAAQMVELEIAVEMNDFTIHTLSQLMDFYSRAVDYYVLIQSSSYIYFKNKMKILLLKPSVLEVLNAQQPKIERDSLAVNELTSQSKPDPKPNNSVAKPTNARPSHDYVYKMDTFQLNKELSTMHQKSQIENAVNNYTKVRTLKEEVITSSLIDQKDKLRRKIEQRKTTSVIRNQDKSGLSIDKTREEIVRRLGDKKIQPNNGANGQLKQGHVGQISYQGMYGGEGLNLYEQMATRRAEQESKVPIEDDAQLNLQGVIYNQNSLIN